MIQVIKLNSQAEIDQFAMGCFCAEYDLLQHIPDFKIRIDTAKANFAKTLNFMDSELFTDSILLIQNTKFYDEQSS